MILEDTLIKATQQWDQDYFPILRRLDGINFAFKFLVEYKMPIFDDRCETACVSYSQTDHSITFHIHPEFFVDRDIEFKAFIISHEAFHVYLNHLFMLDKIDLDIANIAMDIVINEWLARIGFDKDIVDPQRLFYWYDYLDSIGVKYEVKKSFNYYYNLLIKNKNLSDIKDKQLIGDHTNQEGHNGMPESDLKDWLGYLEEIYGKDFTDRIKNEVCDLIESTCESDKATLPGGQKAGSVGGSHIFNADTKTPVKQKSKWETVINKWAKNKMKPLVSIKQDWAGTNRRFTCIDSEFILPNVHEVKNKIPEKSKIQVWFFQDTSGSCISFANRFFKAARTLPKEYFDVKMHCFDTKVYETTLESGKLYGFGGTSFHIIEDYIQKYIKKQDLKYPDAVFMVTDGEGDHVRPQIPENWYWFLGGSTTTRYIPEKSKKNTYYLTDFE